MNDLGYMAMDQYGSTYHLKTKYPRKELMELFYRKRAEKMYQDTLSGETKHIGYIVAGLWLSVYKVSEFK